MSVIIMKVVAVATLILGALTCISQPVIFNWNAGEYLTAFRLFFGAYLAVMCVAAALWIAAVYLDRYIKRGITSRP